MRQKILLIFIALALGIFTPKSSSANPIVDICQRLFKKAPVAPEALTTRYDDLLLKLDELLTYPEGNTKETYLPARSEVRPVMFAALQVFQNLHRYNPIYKTKKLPAQYAWEKDRSRHPAAGGIQYHSTKVEFDSTRLSIGADGLLRDHKGQLVDTDNANRNDRDKRPHAIYVMNAQGEMFFHKHHFPGEFHHSSLVNGEAVACAGTMIVKQGRLISISNNSGHYKPGTEHFLQAIHQLLLVHKLDYPIDLEVVLSPQDRTLVRGFQLR